MSNRQPISTFLGIAAAVVVATDAAAAIINVPVDQPTIQAAIDIAVAGDEIIVDTGTYNEAIDFLGKAITVRSTDPLNPAVVAITIIDGTGNFHVVQCVNGETAATVLDGFTITGGNANGVPPDNVGGGMLNNGSSPTVTNCTFSGNTATDGGGGMFNNGSSPTVTNCTFSGNTATVSGGGMFNFISSPTVTNCRFVGNTATLLFGGGMANATNSNPTVINCTFTGNQAVVNGGGGMDNDGSSPSVVNCTFSGNLAGPGGGIYNFGLSSNPTVTNCIVWGNTSGQIFDDGSAVSTVSFTDVQGGLLLGMVDGGGNIDADPLFVDADGADNVVGTADDDLRLPSNSPCIDAADNTAVPVGITTDLDGNPRFKDDPNTTDTGNGTAPIVDMGAYEFQPPCPADINGDGSVNVLDLVELLLAFGTTCP